MTNRITTAAEARQEVAEARAVGRTPNLRGADLRGADLRDADLRNADLRGADLRNADLRNADLRDADLWNANLWNADLWNADLWNANLRDANLRDAAWDGLRIDGLPSHQLTLTPTPDGWHLTIGCWNGTPDDLRTLIDGDDWPEAKGDEITRRRPLLQAALALVDAHTTDQADTITELANHWKENTDGTHN